MNRIELARKLLVYFVEYSKKYRSFEKTKKCLSYKSPCGYEQDLNLDTWIRSPTHYRLDSRMFDYQTSFAQNVFDFREK